MRELLVLGIAFACACSNKPHKPEADPAKVAALAETMTARIPGPAGVRECKLDEVIGGATLTKRTLLQLAKRPIPSQPEAAEYVNPADLDSPAARTLVEATADTSAQRQAAAELLAAPFYLVYHIDLVDEPLAMGIKDFKRGNVGARAIRYDASGTPSCVLVFFWSNDPAKKEWAIKKSDHPTVDPAVVKAMQDDLRAQMLIRIGSLAAPAPKHVGPADDRSDRN